MNLLIWKYKWWNESIITLLDIAWCHFAFGLRKCLLLSFSCKKDLKTIIPSLTILSLLNSCMCMWLQHINFLRKPVPLSGYVVFIFNFLKCYLTKCCTLSYLQIHPIRPARLACKWIFEFLFQIFSKFISKITPFGVHLSESSNFYYKFLLTSHTRTHKKKTIYLK